MQTSFIYDCALSFVHPYAFWASGYSDLMNPQSLNLYGYVNNNPLSKADRTVTVLMLVWLKASRQV